MLAATLAVVLSPLAEPPVANRVGLAPEENFAPLNTDHSFGAPVDDVNIFTGLRQIDSWTAGGSAIVHRNFVRLTSERQGQKGWLMNRPVFRLPEWSLMMELRASGSNPYLFGDGLAIWLTDRSEVIEGPVFGREDYWRGLGIFFDTFQNIDHQHHHKHPYIYAMVNDGKMHYVPDAEMPQDAAQQALPGAKANSGCSFDFRYHEEREDVSVLNHTRVHVTYRDKTLKLRLQQTSPQLHDQWTDCFEVKDVVLPAEGYFAITSATGDLVDNHDIVQFSVRSLEGVDDPNGDYDRWEHSVRLAHEAKSSDYELRPQEVMQRDYARVVRAQASALRSLTADVEQLKQQLEFRMAAMQVATEVTRENMDDKSDEVANIASAFERTERAASALEEHSSRHLLDITKKLEAVSGSSGWRLPFFFLFLLITALGGIGYNRYRKIMKSHLL